MLHVTNNNRCNINFLSFVGSMHDAILQKYLIIIVIVAKATSALFERPQSSDNCFLLQFALLQDFF